MQEFFNHEHNGCAAKKCGAHCRTTGQPCKNPPVTGAQRCRMHGGRSSGRPVVSGQHTQQAVRRRREIKDLIGSVNSLITQMKDATR